MFRNKIKKIQKRDGQIVKFDQAKITDAIFKALTATGQGDGKKSKRLSNKVVEILNRRFKPEETPHVEQIQDIVEEILILEGFVETARAYILYREQRRRIREAVKVSEEAVDRLDQYLEKTDWEVQENANMAFSLQGLNRFGTSYIIKRYWLNKIYPKEIREANENCDLHIHNLDTLGPYTFFGREVVIAKLKGEIKLLSLKDLYEELSESEFLLNENNQAFAKYPKDLFVLDQNSWTRVSRMVRKKKNREMRFIKSEQGRSVIVTDNHPFIVKQNRSEDWKEIEAKDVQEKNNLVLSCHIPSLLSKEKLFFKKHLYLAEELLNRDYKTFFLEGFEWQDFIKNWGGSLKSEGTLSTANWANSLDNKLELTEDLGYLVGLFIAEGFYDNWRIGIATSEEETINKIRRISAKLGLRAYVRDKKNSETTKNIIIGCSTLSLVFKQIFQLKKGSKNKILPPDILTYNSDFIRGVIAGITDGDGTRGSKDKDGQYAQILIRVSSRIMLEQIAILLQFFGITGRDRVSIEDTGKKNMFQGKEIVQNYPLYGLSFSKKENVNFPSFKYQKARPAKQHWRAEEYGWNKVLNNEFTTIADDFIYDITTDSNTFLCNSLLVHNCAGWDLYDFLLKGFGGVPGKMESKPPAHFESALGQVVNFIFTVSGEVAGAVAFSNFDTLLVPFIRYDNLNYKQVKQSLQEFLFNMATPTRVGFQCPFSNITLDLKPSPVFAKMPVIIGGKPRKETYGEFEEEMKVFNKALYEAILEGDKNGRTFSFPIPTINITKDFPWDEPAFDGLWEASAKYGINYFANYIQSSMKPEDVTAMCCRLLIDKRQLYNRGGGGLFGSGANTGSLGVVSINVPRIGYLSKTKKEFFGRLGEMMDLAKESLEIKRKALESFIEKSLYPYSKFYLSGVKKMRGQYYGNHFSTIGPNGMNEALLNFMGETIASKRGRKFASEVLDFMRERLVQYQKETDNIYNLEAVPAESTAFRFALRDKEKYPEIITAGTKQSPYYTNSTHLPVNYTDDVFEALKLQDELQTKYTGGTILHFFLGEKVSDLQTAKNLVRKVFEKFRLPYITLTPTFSICPNHGYLAGEYFECPKCTIKQPCEVYSRIVGYLRPVKQWNLGKKEEFKWRREYRVYQEDKITPLPKEEIPSQVKT
jgi:ribonucleoside-triphosphate reductase